MKFVDICRTCRRPASSATRAAARQWPRDREQGEGAGWGGTPVFLVAIVSTQAQAVPGVMRSLFMVRAMQYAEPDGGHDDRHRCSLACLQAPVETRFTAAGDRCLDRDHPGASARRRLFRGGYWIDGWGTRSRSHGSARDPPLRADVNFAERRSQSLSPRSSTGPPSCSRSASRPAVDAVRRILPRASVRHVEPDARRFPRRAGDLARARRRTRRDFDRGVVRHHSPRARALGVLGDRRECAADVVHDPGLPGLHRAAVQ